MTVPKYITGLSRQDLEDIAAATNLSVGPGIDIERQGNSIRISVNQSQLRRWMRAFYQNGGMSCSTSQIDDISLDLS